MLWLMVALIVAWCAAGSAAALAGQVTLAWDASTDPAVTGYKLYYGTATRNYTSSVDVHNVTTYTVPGLTEGLTYYFAAVDYDTYGSESVYSNEVVYTVPTVPDIGLFGNGVAIANGDATPLAADFTDFGSADVSGGTVTRTFTVQNPGSGALSLTGTPAVAVSGANAADFVVTVAPAATVAAAGSTTFQVRFDPGASGTRSATISIASNVAAKSPYTFAIQGTGTTAPDISLAGNAVTIASGDTTPSTADFTDFGGTDVSGGTVTRTFTVQNPGSGALNLTGTPAVAVSGANAADFVVTVAPAATVAAAGSTTFQVRFDPGASGTRSATISIASNVAAKSPYTFAIQGTGTTAPDISLAGNAVTIASGDTTPSTADFTDFGGTDISGGTVTRTFTVQNPGSGALNLTGTPAVAVSGANAADFVVTAAPAATVAAAGSTTFQVRFDPAATGVRSATISIASNVAAKSPYTFAIQGTGTTAPDISLAGNGVTIASGDTTPSAADFTDFGKNRVGGTLTRTFTVQNPGSGALNLTGTPAVSVSGANAADFTVTAAPAATVASGGSTTFTVQCTPGAAGTRSATIGIASNVAAKSPYTFAVSGVGVPPPAPPANVRVVP
jgi:hypothetical protein